MTERLPVACRLAGPERQERERALRELIAGEAASVTRRPDGITIRFPGTTGCLPQIAELLELERECCPFLRFALTAEAGRGPVDLTITGPEGTTELLESWYG